MFLKGAFLMAKAAKGGMTLSKANQRRENIAGYLFMLPSLLFFVGFVIFPMGLCLFNSFFNYTLRTPFSLLR